MKPIKFKECNVEFAKDQPEYNSLHAFRDGNGVVVICWKLTLREAIRVMFRRRVWLSLMTFNNPLTPTFMSTKKSDMLEKI
jgi:hypothetical protein